jgi:hypothetical protein
MMTLKKYLLPVKGLLFGWLLTVSSMSLAQVSVQFSPVMGGQSLQNLALTRLTLTSTSSVRLSLTIKVTEVNGAPVVTIKTLPFYTSNGNNQIDRNSFANGLFSFGANYYGNIVRQSGRFPEGEYECCFTEEILDSKDPSILPSYEQCFSYQLQPLTPFLLTFPMDGDIICNKRPSFAWQPPLPLPLDSRFRLILAEVRDKQVPIESITNNEPVINQAALSANTLMFPVNIPELKEGSTYAWQVSIYSNLAIIKKSEIWTFTVRCEEDKKIPPADSYRDLKEADNGDYYIADRYLRFSFNNPYSGGKLSYSIECLSDAKNVVKSLPTLQTSSGINKYDLDLSENNSFKSGNEYLLKVYLPNNKQLRLRFIYKNEGE